MRSALTAAFLLAAASSFAGITYDFHSDTTGLQQMTIDGSVAAQGPNVRMSVSRGDGMLFKDGSIVLSRDNGKTLDRKSGSKGEEGYCVFGRVIDGMDVVDRINRVPTDPEDRPEQAVLVKVSFVNPSVRAADAGDGGAIEGFPTRKSLVDATIDINIDAMGQTVTSKMSMHSESWTTDKLGTTALNVFQERNLLTGIDALDKLIAAQSSALKGRFPLKQATTVHVVANGQDVTTTTTATVSNVKQQPLDASMFAPPQGYSRVDNPLERMTKR